MPIVRIDRTAWPAPSVVASGSSSVTEDRVGTVVSYTGTLTINGVLVLSPSQLRAEWAGRGRIAMRVADRAEHLDPEAHYAARGEVTAYAMGAEALDRVYAPWRKSDAAGKTFVHARLQDAAILLRQAASEVEAAESPEDGLTEVQRGAMRSAAATLTRMAAELDRLGRYDWLADEPAPRGR